jgi:hypothetical protein
MMKAGTVRVAVCVLAMSGLLEAGPLKGSPVSALYRCPTTTECVSPDGIAGDASGAIVGNTSTGRGAFHLAGQFNGELYIRPPDGRTLALDFTMPDGPAPCLQSSTGCRRTFTFVDSEGTNSTTNPRTANDQPLPSLFYGIPVGGSAPSRFKLNFPDPDGRNYLWTIRFNPSEYAGSSFVIVRRTAANVWEVEATAADRARLVSTTTHGQQVMTDEGLFVMPFKIVVVK